MLQEILLAETHTRLRSDAVTVFLPGLRLAQHSFGWWDNLRQVTSARDTWGAEPAVLAVPRTVRQAKLLQDSF